MNLTPRVLNRSLSTFFGAILLAVGIHLLLVAGVADYATWWRGAASALGESAHGVLLATTLPGQQESWLWIVLALLLIVAILLMVWWISVQGRGRASAYVSAYFDDDPMPGRVEISDEAVEQALRAMLGRRADVVSLSVTLWENAPVPGLRIKVQPRTGVAPGELGAEIADAARAAQELMGSGGPVVIHLAGGARSRFARSERVQ